MIDRDRLPPHDLTAEASLLASLILCDGDAEVWSTVQAMVPREAFFMPSHGEFYATMAEARARGSALDAVTIQGLLGQPRLSELGGMAAVAKILNTVPSALHWHTYARIVLDLHQRRQILSLADSLFASAHLPMRDKPAGEIVEAAQRRLAGILEAGTASRYASAQAIAQAAYDALDSDAPPLIPTGFPGLDAVIGGFGAGEFWVMGARPSVGKSTWCRQCAVRVARSGVPVGFISLEESTAKMARNLLSAETGIDNHRIRRGKAGLGQTDFTALAKAVQSFDGLPLHFCATARTLRDIRSVAVTMQARDGVRVLFVDYLQRIRGARGEDRYGQVTEISLEMSDLAKSAGLVVFCPAQLSRGVESREDKRPTMSDLRESGQIEQDCDGVLFLHREDYYHTDDADYQPDGIAEVIVAKCRDGVRGKTVKLGSDLKHQRFLDYVDPQGDPWG